MNADRIDKRPEYSQKVFSHGGLRMDLSVTSQTIYMIDPTRITKFVNEQEINYNRIHTMLETEFAEIKEYPMNKAVLGQLLTTNDVYLTDGVHRCIAVVIGKALNSVPQDMLIPMINDECNKDIGKAVVAFVKNDNKCSTNNTLDTPRFPHRLRFVARMRDAYFESIGRPKTISLQGISWRNIKSWIATSGCENSEYFSQGMEKFEQQQYHQIYLSVQASRYFTSQQLHDELQNGAHGQKRTLDTRTWEIIAIQSNWKPHCVGRVSQFPSVDEIMNNYRIRSPPKIWSSISLDLLYCPYYTRDVLQYTHAEYVKNKIDYVDENITMFEKTLYLSFIANFLNKDKEERKDSFGNKHIKIKKSRETSQRIGFAIHAVCKKWSAVAEELEFEDLESMILPYLFFDTRSLKYVHLQKEDEFSPDLQKYTFMHGLGILKIDEVENFEYLDPTTMKMNGAASNQLRNAALSFLKHISECVEDPLLYETINQWEGTVVSRFLSDERKENNLVSVLLEQLSEVKQIRRSKRSRVEIRKSYRIE